MCLNNSLLYLKYIVIFSIYRLDKFSPFPAFLFCIHLQIVLTSAWELTLDLLNLEDFGFLDPDLQKYWDPQIRIQGVKYQTETAKKNFLFLKPKSEF